MSKVKIKYKPYNDPENPIVGYLRSNKVIISAIGATEEEVFEKLCKKTHHYYKELPKIRDFILEKQGLLTVLY